MGTRNVVWAQRQRAGGPLEKLLFLHICDAIPERGPDPHLETSLGYLAHYGEAELWQALHALLLLQDRGLIRLRQTADRIFLRIPFPT